MSQPIVYDKAKYHYETIEKHGLPKIHAYIHTGLYLGWLIDNELISEDLKEDFDKEISKFINRDLTAPELFTLLDGAFVDDMLNEIGNRFSQYYFDFENGQYIHDYMKNVTQRLPSELHAQNTWDNYETVSKFVTARFNEWESNSIGDLSRSNIALEYVFVIPKWWQFWKKSLTVIIKEKDEP